MVKEFKVRNVFVEESEAFENYVGKRLISIMCGNIPFEQACKKILKDIVNEKEGNDTSTKQLVTFTKPKKYKKVSLR